MADQKENQAAPKTASPFAGKKVMWVEDDKFLSDMIARTLSKEGFQLVSVDNGNDALPTAKEKKPDIILLDILLPGKDGFQILKELKQDPELKTVPVIFLSNLGQKSDIEKGKELGAEKFLIKATVTLEEIAQEIEAVLEKSSKK